MSFSGAGLINAGAAGGEYMVAKTTAEGRVGYSEPQRIYVIVSCAQCQCCTTQWRPQQLRMQPQRVDELDETQEGIHDINLKLNDLRKDIEELKGSMMQKKLPGAPVAQP